MSLGGFVHFYIWNRRMACRKNCCRFLPSATQEQVPAARLLSTHCHKACQKAGMPSAVLGGDSNDLSRAAFAQARPNGAKIMAPR